VIDDAQVFNHKLQEWEDYYNYHRPHGGLNGQTPYERLRIKTQTKPARGATRQRQLHREIRADARTRTGNRSITRAITLVCSRK